MAEATGFQLRKARDEDAAALSAVCLATADSGKDASHFPDDPDLPGLYYVLPYLAAAPGFAHVVEDAAGVCGYVLGVPDTRAFHAFMERDWLPPLRARIAPPGPKAGWRHFDWIRQVIHHRSGLPPVDLRLYPAHGHIDLMPRAQGRGLGTRAMQALMRDLAASGARGMHLEVSPQNPGAIAFYERLGFHRLPPVADRADTVFMARGL